MKFPSFMMNKPFGLALSEVFGFHSSLSFMHAGNAAIKNKKVIQDDEGEYIDFEDIKEK